MELIGRVGAPPWEGWGLTGEGWGLMGEGGGTPVGGLWQPRETSGAPVAEPREACLKAGISLIVCFLMEKSPIQPAGAILSQVMICRDTQGFHYICIHITMCFNMTRLNPLTLLLPN